MAHGASNWQACGVSDDALRDKSAVLGEDSHAQMSKRMSCAYGIDISLFDGSPRPPGAGRS
ncbi:Hypothetical protein BN69_1185 [Methylocystis sp. SC2]|nr:Hypothetical protein BN69_1185 [Methylocystis sp. SC2]